MKLLTIEDLRMLAATHSGPCLTLTMPTHTDPTGAAQDPLVLRDLLRQAGEQLDANVRDALLAPLRALDTPEFWAHQTGGLALYSAKDLAVYYRVTGTLPARAHVADHFLVRPLLSHLRTGTRYLVLALSMNHVALFQGTLAELHPVKTSEVPHSMSEALGAEWRERLLNTHSHGHGPLAFHGHGEPSQDKHDDALRFFRQVDEGLWPLLHDADLPLILAGVEQTQALFRQVTRYRHVVPGGITGAVAHESAAQLFERVRPIAERLAAEREAQAVAEFERHERHGRATASLDALARAAVQGRVRRLLVADDAQVGGHVDRETGALRQGHGQELLEELAELVLLRGGDVLSVPRKRMPGEHAAAATLRW
jgi:hypothetical protein